MPKKTISNEEKIVDLLEKNLIVQLYFSGVTQEGIAKKLRIAKKAVNDFLKGVSKNKN
jgi:hypothetical protein